MVSVRAAVMERPGHLGVREFPMPEPEPGAVLMQCQLFRNLRHRQAHVPGREQAVCGHRHERDLTYPLICGHENVGGSPRPAAWCSTARGSPRARRPHRPRRQRALRQLPYLPQQLPLLFLRADGGLRQQPPLRTGAASLRRLGRVHVPAARDADLPRARRAPRQRRGADGDHGGHPRGRDRARHCSG